PKLSTMGALDALDCPFVSSVVCEGQTGDLSVTTTRSGGATCIDGHSVGANEACISTVGLESFPSGSGDRSAADVHTVSTAGWPTSSGSVDLQYTPAGTPAINTYILDARAPGSSTAAGYGIYFNGTANLVGFTANGTTRYDVPTSGLEWEAGKTYAIRLIWSGTTVTLYRALCDGECAALTQVAQRTDAGMPTGMNATAALGSNSGGLGQP